VGRNVADLKLKPKSMIQAKDLRIGNIVAIQHMITPIRLTQISIYKEEDKCDTFSGESIESGLYRGGPVASLMGIPLTADLLKKAGFRYEPIGHNDFHLSATWENYQFSLNEYTDRTFGFEWGTEGEILDIYYLHQLQNLHFALTGKELDVVMPACFSPHSDLNLTTL
jgi:hypothetical protein